LFFKWTILLATVGPRLIVQHHFPALWQENGVENPLGQNQYPTRYREWSYTFLSQKQKKNIQYRFKLEETTREYFLSVQCYSIWRCGAHSSRRNTKHFTAYFKDRENLLNPIDIPERGKFQLNLFRFVTWLKMCFFSMLI